jgi:hypothetical protein
MGREVRRVPKDWQHPRDDSGRFIPMYDGDQETACREWFVACMNWTLRADHPADEWYWHYAHPPEDFGERACHMFEHPRDDLTHFMMYESTSEGTPISPAFETAEELARWLADTGASSFGPFTATYEEWLAMIGHGSAPSAIIEGGIMRSGVEFLGEHKEILK